MKTSRSYLARLTHDELLSQLEAKTLENEVLRGKFVKVKESLKYALTVIKTARAYINLSARGEKMLDLHPTHIEQARQDLKLMDELISIWGKSLN